MNPVLKQIVNHLIGDLLRKGLAVLGVWLAAKGIGYLTPDSQSNLVDLAVGAIVCLGTVGWSLARNHKALNTKIKLDELTSSFQPTSAAAVIQPEKKSLTLPAILLSTFLVASLTSCAVMSKFDQNSYTAATELKYQSLQLVALAGEPYANHAKGVEYLKANLDAQLAYQDGKGKANIISATQWNILISEDHNLLGKLLKDWREGKSFSPSYLKEKQGQIADAFDEILRLEGAKTK
jgi:hypothetical protein